MPINVYDYVHAEARKLLSAHYALVKTPIACPGKTEYGDVDFIVAAPKTTRMDIMCRPTGEVFENLRNAMAPRMAIHHGDRLMQFALPWPKHLLPGVSQQIRSPSLLAKDNGFAAFVSPEATSDLRESSASNLLDFNKSGPREPDQGDLGTSHDKILAKQSSLSPNIRKSRIPNNSTSEATEPGDIAQPLYCQVDVQHCHDVSDMDFRLFQYSHGDLVNLINICIRPLGLLIGGAGLCIRVLGFEKQGGKRPKVSLTRKSEEILDFLGLDVERFSRPFHTNHELFEYMATCRFWSPMLLGVKSRSNEHEDASGANQEVAWSRWVYGRPLVKEWLQEYVLKLQSEKSSDLTPDTVRQMVFETFPNAKKAYDQLLDLSRLESHMNFIHKVAIKQSIPAVEEIGILHHQAALSALLAIFPHDPPKNVMIPEAARVDANGFYDEDKVRQYAASNWERLGDAALGLADLEETGQLIEGQPQIDQRFLRGFRRIFARKRQQSRKA